MGAQRPERPPPGHSLLLPRVGDDATQRALDAVKGVNRQVQQTAAATQQQVDALRVFAAAPPVGGNPTVTDIIWNSAPASGGFIGWVFTAAGWKTFGPIS